MFYSSFFLFIFTLLYLFFNYARFLSPSQFLHDLVPRGDLVLLSWKALLSSPLFGLGLNNFYYFEGSHQTYFSSIYLQPVHNIFLLIAVQTGVLGLFTFLYFFIHAAMTSWKYLRKEKKIFSYNEIPLVLLLTLIVAGLFDHYPLTVGQGELLSAIILGLIFNRKI